MDSRGTSITLNYVLGIGIIALLVSGLVFAGTEFVEDRRENVVRSELQVAGQQLVSELDRADRLVAADNPGSPDPIVSVRLDLPPRVAGSSYDISLKRVSPSEKYVVLDPTLTDVVVKVPISEETPITDDATVDGGPVRIVYDTATDKFVIEDDS